MLSDSRILRQIERQSKQSASWKQLVRELGVRGDERRELASQLENLVQRGELVLMEAAHERYSLPRATASRNLIIGRLSMHRDGYGFVAPLDGPAKDRIAGDVFIAPPAIGDAMHGDRVQVELKAIQADGRAEGRILRVLQRAHPTLVGTFHYGPRRNYIVPIDEKITQDVIIPHGQEIPPEAGAGAPRGASRHRVLGSEAVRRRPLKDDANGDMEGMVVEVEVTQWPTPTQNPQGRVVEVLGYEDDFGVDVEIIIRKYHLPHRFPPEVLEEAQRIPNAIPARETARRRDFRHLPVVTIDGETARDFDDAVHVQPPGQWELRIAGAHRRCRPVRAPRLGARHRGALRGTSVYFPDRAVPMLPVELSTDLCSLRPNLDRLVMSCVMEIDHRGDILGYELCAGRHPFGGAYDLHGRKRHFRGRQGAAPPLRPAG